MPVRYPSQGVLQQAEHHSAAEFLTTVHPVERAPEQKLINDRVSELLELTPVHTDTYSAICAFITTSKAVQTNLDDISDKDLDDLLAWLDAINCDISSHQDFPSSTSGEKELETAITLLARLQNRLVLLGEKIQDMPMLEDITQYCLTSRKDKALRYNLGKHLSTSLVLAAQVLLIQPFSSFLSLPRPRSGEWVEVRGKHHCEDTDSIFSESQHWLTGVSYQKQESTWNGVLIALLIRLGIMSR
jgi:hypothetical protein